MTVAHKVTSAIICCLHNFLCYQTFCPWCGSGSAWIHITRDLLDPDPGGKNRQRIGKKGLNNFCYLFKINKKGLCHNFFKTFYWQKKLTWAPWTDINGFAKFLVFANIFAKSHTYLRIYSQKATHTYLRIYSLKAIHT